MSRTEIRRVQENRQSYYEGMYRAQSYSYPYRKAYTEKDSTKKSSLDTILFTIIKGLLVCLVIVVLLATFCSAEDVAMKTRRGVRMTPQIHTHRSMYIMIDSIQKDHTFSPAGK